MPICEWCGKEFFAGDGAWDDGDYMCGECIAAHIDDSEQEEQNTSSGNESPDGQPESPPKS
jgi:hypothetical protein